MNLQTPNPKTSFSRTGLRVLIAFLHAIAILITCWIFSAIDYNFSLEENLLSTNSTIKQLLIPEKAPDLREYLYVDASASKTLIPKSGDSGYEVITNREELRKLFSAINQVSAKHYKGGGYQFVICDLLFDRAGPDDASLGRVMDSINKLIIPSPLSGSDPNQPPFLNLLNGNASYKISSGIQSSSSFLKYNLMPAEQDKSLPVKVFELNKKLEVTSSMGLLWIDGKPFFKNVPMDIDYNDSVVESLFSSRAIPLSELNALLLADPKTFFDRFLKDKFILIGDYENDRHQTIQGVFPGPVILSIVLQSMREGRNQVSAGLVFYMIFCLTILTWIFLNPPRWLDNAKVKYEKTYFSKFFGSALILVIAIWLIGFIEYLVFGTSVDPIAIVFYYLVLGELKQILTKKQPEQ